MVSMEQGVRYNNHDVRLKKNNTKPNPEMVSMEQGVRYNNHDVRLLKKITPNLTRKWLVWNTAYNHDVSITRPYENLGT